MGEGSAREPTAEVANPQDLLHSQLVLYARDLKRAVDLERQKSRELVEANARLKILDRLKTDFLSFVSHELRTPLTIMANVELLDPAGDAEEQQRVIQMIRRGYGRLLAFVARGLDYFRWLAAEKRVTSEVTDLAALARRVAGELPALASADVDFELKVHGGPCRVRGSEAHLGEVPRILLENALKFSHDEKFIRAEVRGTDGEVELSVADHGAGVAAEMLEEIFRPFTVADVQHHSRGTGLNLALARAIVEAHGGRLRAASPGEGRGATFTVQLPASKE